MRWPPPSLGGAGGKDFVKILACWLVVSLVFVLAGGSPLLAVGLICGAALFRELCR